MVAELLAQTYETPRAGIPSTTKLTHCATTQFTYHGPRAREDFIAYLTTDIRAGLVGGAFTSTTPAPGDILF